MAVNPDPDLVATWGPWIGGLLATIAGGFIAKFSLKKGRENDSTVPESFTQVSGALVDGTSVTKLAAAIESVHATMIKAHRHAETVEAGRGENLRHIAKAIESLSDSVAHTNVLTERGENDRERRERDKLKEERDQLQRNLDDARRQLSRGDTSNLK